MCKILPVFLPSQSPSFPPITYRDIPVLTTDMLAQAYEVDPNQIRQNFKRNIGRFTISKHFFQISGNELNEFKNCVTNCHLVQIGKRSASLTLWTERGAARHAKMLNSDRAWDVFELLEETFFRIVKPHPASLSPFLQIKTLPRVQRERLNELVLSKIAHIPPHLVWKTRMSVWAAFNRRFCIPRYCLLPEARMSEAVLFLSELEIGPQGKVKIKANQYQFSKKVDEIQEITNALSSLVNRAQEILKLNGVEA